MRDRMGQKQQVARVVLLLSCGVAMVCGLVMMALGIWTVNDKMFLDELLRNRLYVDTAYIILVAATSITVLSCFGCFAAMREIRCFLLAYFLALLLLTVILAVAGVISYVFREQVTSPPCSSFATDSPLSRWSGQCVQRC